MPVLKTGLNESYTRSLLTGIAAIRKTPSRLFCFLSLLIFTAAFNLNALAQSTVSQFFQGFEVNNIWAASPPSTQTVTRVSSGTNGIASRTGGFHAEVGTQFTRWGGYNSTFPSRGYTTTVAVYLNVGGGFANDTRFDFSSAINQPNGNHRRDFVFNAGYYNDVGGPGSGLPRFVVSAGNNSGRANSFPKNGGAIAITSSGWYIFKHRFYDSGGGVLAVEMSIIDSSNSVVNSWTLSTAADVIGSTVGGNRYGWFANNEFAFLAIDDSERANFVAPTVTINQAIGQADPTSTSPINFTVTFNEPVTGFDASDVVLSGTAGATGKLVTGGPSVYNVAVSGMTTSGTVIATISAGGATSTGTGAPNEASTSTDNSVTYFTCNNISAPTGMTALRNTLLTVPISTDSVTGRGIISYDYTFTYNSSVLSFNSVDKVGTISSGMEVTVNSSTPGTLIISGFGPSDLTGSGTLIKLNFNVDGAIGTSSALGFSSFTFNEGVPCVNTTNGSFTVVSGTISGAVTYLNSAAPRAVAGTLLTASGAILVTDTTDAGGLYDLSGLGNSAYTVTPSKTGDVSPGGIDSITSFDASKIAQHVVLISPFILNGGAYKSADVSGNGTITSFDAALVARYVALLPDSGSTGTWRFEPVSRPYTLAQVQSGMTNQNYSAILMGEVTGNWNGVANPTRPSSDYEKVRPEDVINISAPALSAEAGSDFVIPVTIQNTKGKGIIAYQFDLSYAPKVIRPQSNPCDVLETVSKDFSVTCNTNIPGLLKVVVFGTVPLNAGGILLNLKFAAVGSSASSSPLTIKELLLNEGGLVTRVTNGEVIITDPSDNSDSISGRLLISDGGVLGDTEVILTATNGEARGVYTNDAGEFRFAKVTIGETYILTVNSKSYVFKPQFASAGRGITRLDIIAEP